MINITNVKVIKVEESMRVHSTSNKCRNKRINTKSNFK